jgi:hypothetical protein
VVAGALAVFVCHAGLSQVVAEQSVTPVQAVVELACRVAVQIAKVDDAARTSPNGMTRGSRRGRAVWQSSEAGRKLGAEPAGRAYAARGDLPRI